jgi:FixJ family two-component response regulator
MAAQARAANRLMTDQDFRVSNVPTISIIDDDSSVRVAMEDLVNSLGFVAHAFECAGDFLRSPQIDNTTCLIADVQMPGMNGLELQSELLAQGRRIPIIFITAFPDVRLRKRAEAAGAVAFLEKPFDGCTLVSILHTAVKSEDQ